MFLFNLLKEFLKVEFLIHIMLVTWYRFKTIRWNFRIKILPRGDQRGGLLQEQKLGKNGLKML